MVLMVWNMGGCVEREKKILKQFQPIGIFRKSTPFTPFSPYHRKNMLDGVDVVDGVVLCCKYRYTIFTNGARDIKRMCTVYSMSTETMTARRRS